MITFEKNFLKIIIAATLTYQVKQRTIITIFSHKD